MKNKKTIIIIGFILSIILFFMSGIKVPIIDKSADNYFNDSITKAGLAYATCRVINASISVIKDSNVQVQPAGVGMTLAVGQIVDPIDDATERLSDVLATVIVSLGIEKLLYEISISLVPPILAVILIVILFLYWLNNEELKNIQKTLLRILLIIIFARFCLPVSSLANNFIHKNFFEKKIADTKKELSMGSSELDKIKEFSFPEVGSFLNTLKNSAFFLKRQTMQFKNALIYTVKNVGNIINNLINLLFLYVGVFIIQVILLPLLMFWIFIKMLNSFFSTNLPLLIRHPRRIKEQSQAVNGTGK